MPFISTKTNVNVPKDKEVELKERLGKAIEAIPGKSESWLMVAIEGDIPMYFKGQGNEPTAFVEVKIFGDASKEAYANMTKELSRVYAEVLGVKPDRLYVRYQGGTDWGWNGNNF
ncbi:MAG: hypothetical protein K6A92_05180 [Lachnospiraceae bacterium]|nr:hypothetical protein [Lachnospiraceae bacterium]